MLRIGLSLFSLVLAALIAWPTLSPAADAATDGSVGSAGRGGLNVAAPEPAQEFIVWTRGYPEVGPSGCVDYVAQWSDGTYTATPWDCGPETVARRGDLTATRGYPQRAANGCIEYVTQWNDGSYTWVPFWCPAGVTYYKPGTPAPLVPTGVERAVQAAVARFERGHMIWRQDTQQIYVLYDDGRWAAYPDTFGPGDPERVGLTPPAGLLEPIRGFGKVWRDAPGVRDRIGWQVAPEQGVQGTVREEGDTTVLDTRGLGRWLIRGNGTFDKVR